MSVETSTMLWNVFTYLLGSILVLGLILIVYLTIMHTILGKKLDPILFKAPWFNPSQLIMFSSWPMGLFKTINYLFLLTYPNYARKRNKRLKELKDIPGIEPSLLVASKMYIFLHIFFVLLGITWLLYMITLITLLELGII